MKPLWLAWQESWRRMEQIALRRGWECFTHRIAPPASPLSITNLEEKCGLAVPAQLREVLTGFSARVQFGWRIPAHIRPQDRLGLPATGGLRDILWDIEHIEEQAIPSFNSWRTGHARPADSEREAPSAPETWEGQFPFAALMNGDMLTIDCAAPDGPQPVRYLSHDLEGLHGSAIAPDFLSFITEYSALGCAGSGQSDWLAFCEQASDGSWRLDAGSPGACAWREWLTADPHKQAADEPPPVVLARNRADRELLESARADHLEGVAAALDQGANPDCCLEGDWSDEFVTAFIHAARHDNIPMMELLVSRGATINTRRLPLGEAAASGAPETVRWLIAHGARPNGWKDDRHWPLHRLIEHRAENAPQGGAANREEAFFAILNALLEAGADPDAPWDNGLTMLMRCGPKTAERLLAHGADPNRRADNGLTPLHLASSAELVRLLTVSSANVNALSKPLKESANDIPLTPLQSCLSAYGKSNEVITALLELGADPLLKDGQGRNAVWYCRSVDDLELVLRGFEGRRFDWRERASDGGTLVHNLCSALSCSFAHIAEYRDLIRYFVNKGVDINAADNEERTALHLVAKSGEPEDAGFLLELGADKSARDKAGRTPRDLTPAFKSAVREMLG